MRHILEKHHCWVGIFGLVIATGVLAIIALTFFPKKMIAPTDLIARQQNSLSENPANIHPVSVSITENTRVQPKQVITGKVPGYYFFEGSFPVMFFDINDQPFGSVIASTNEDWMVTQNVSFELTLPDNFSYTGPGSILFKKDDPSGGEAPFDPVYDQYKIPVIFTDGAE